MSNLAHKPLFADVILPLPLRQLYTYALPEEMKDSVSAGKRVVVPFGKSKYYTAVVRLIHQQAPVGYEPKEVVELLDDDRVVTDAQFKMWEWMAEYYMCTIGEVMVAAMPADLKLQSETVLTLADGDDVVVESVLTFEEEAVVEAIRGKSLSIGDAIKASGTKKGLRLVRELVEKGVLAVHEEMRESFKPRASDYVRYTQAANDEQFLKTVFDQLEKRSPKQLEILMQFIRLCSEKGRNEVLKSQLLRQSGASSTSLQQLVSKGVLEVFSAESDLHAGDERHDPRKFELSVDQSTALDQIHRGFSEQKPVLLHGVTSSGKTEIYIRLMQECIDRGEQSLYLLPEIALTTQIINRLKLHFGDRLLVYHSRYAPRDRAEVYMRMIRDGEGGKYKYPIIVGARSAVFLPLKKPGLIIVDEEHDSSYKQTDPAPRYNARDTAVVNAAMYGCRLVLGSATPSLETYGNALGGKYSLVELHTRFGGIRMPEIELIDLKDAYKKKRVKAFFSLDLLDAIRTSLDSKEQVILFQNRRGFAPMMECSKCSWSPRCVNCDVSLTYHKHTGQNKCHYCGYSISPPKKCTACGDTDVRMRGMGTERIEDEIAVFFPDAKVARLDLDTGSSKSSYSRIIHGFESGEIDILVGTQMVTKGLDFDNVGLVGVLNADNLLGYPDFRSAERSFQLLSQVSGRAGRRFKRGRVVVQTFDPSHPVLGFVVNHDYKGFYEYELKERSQFQYPPLHRLIRFKLRHKDLKQLNRFAEYYTRDLRNVFGNRLLGPAAPAVSRVRNYYILLLLLKLERNAPFKQVRESIRKVTDEFQEHPSHRSLLIQIDVDPQ
ncbi:MAG: primosomal protein N' [Bacteroidota bacterium]